MCMLLALYYLFTKPIICKAAKIYFRGNACYIRNCTSFEQVVSRHDVSAVVLLRIQFFRGIRPCH
jgi:hypothetical protein